MPLKQVLQALNMVICNLLNEQAAKAMADAKVYLVPTLATYEALANDELEH